MKIYSILLGIIFSLPVLGQNRQLPLRIQISRDKKTKPEVRFRVMINHTETGQEYKLADNSPLVEALIPINATDTVLEIKFIIGNSQMFFCRECINNYISIPLKYAKEIYREVHIDTNSVVKEINATDGNTKRLALIIGSNKAPHDIDYNKHIDLKQCLKNVEEVTNFFYNSGYDIIYDTDAIYNNTINKLEKLSSIADEYDYTVIYLSGYICTEHPLSIFTDSSNGENHNNEINIWNYLRKFPLTNKIILVIDGVQFAHYNSNQYNNYAKKIDAFLNTLPKNIRYFVSTQKFSVFNRDANNGSENVVTKVLLQNMSDLNLNITEAFNKTSSDLQVKNISEFIHPRISQIKNDSAWLLIDRSSEKGHILFTTSPKAAVTNKNEYIHQNKVLSDADEKADSELQEMGNISNHTAAIFEKNIKQLNSEEKWILGYFYYNKNDTINSLKYLRQAVAEGSDDAMILLGDYFVTRGEKIDSAIALYNIAKDEYDNEDAYCHLALIYDDSLNLLGYQRDILAGEYYYEAYRRGAEMDKHSKERLLFFYYHKNMGIDLLDKKEVISLQKELEDENN